MKQKFLYLFVAACLSLLSGFADSARAQSLGLTPAMMEATVKPGAAYTNTFSLTNATNTRLRVRCSVNDYWYDELNRRITGLAGTLPRSASNWVQFTPAEIIIEPHSSGSAKAIITIPAGATGGYYTVPVFETEAADISVPEKGSAQATIGLRLEGLLLLTTEAGTEYNVEVMGGQVSPPTSSSPLQMSLELRNRSTAHARVHGVFALLDASGKLAGRGRIEEKRYMPGQRDFSKTVWAGELSPGKYTAVITLSYDRAGLEPTTLVYEIPFESASVIAAARP